MTKRDLVAKDGRAIGYIIGSAVINKEFGDFSCSYSTFGFSKNIDSSAVGVDALQAIFLAAMQVSVFIQGSNECNDLSLHWNDANRECDLGLEVPQLELRWNYGDTCIFTHLLTVTVHLIPVGQRMKCH